MYLSYTKTASDFYPTKFMPHSDPRVCHQCSKCYYTCRLIEPSQEILYDQFKKAYADILYRWDLLDKRAEVLKYVSIPPEPHTGVGKIWQYVSIHTI